ncbi:MULTISPECIES: C40 family peptidase [Amycolatopsis]
MIKALLAAAVAIVGLTAFTASAISGAASAVLGSGSGSQPSTTALADIPPDYLELYQLAAATCPGLDWTILAAIGKVESDHGRSQLPGVLTGENFAGAGGPMQFLQATWDQVTARHPLPPGGATPPSRYNPHDAIYTAAAYLCDSGARDGRDIHAAIFAYNHSDAYVNQVLTQAQDYRSAAPTFAPASSPAAQAAINYARGQLGLPYVWGGDGPAAGDAGFDCSGLTHAAYEAAGIELPRTAQQQYNAGPLVPAGAPLAPGDLLFFGTPSRVHHVGIFIGGTAMIHAPDFGKPIQVQQDFHTLGDFVGASRPWNDHQGHFQVTG